MNTLLLLFPLLWASPLHASKSSNSCCPLDSFVRILDIFNGLQQSYTEEPHVPSSPNPCPTISGHPGEPVCRTDGSIASLLPAVLLANLRCPYLSPVSISIPQGRFECVAYGPPTTSFACPGGAEIDLCRYDGISDTVQLAGLAKECASTGSNLSCTVLEPAPAPNGCSPTISEAGIAYPLTAAYCLTSVTPSFPSPYAPLLAQFQCPAGNRLIVGDKAGCFVIQNSPVVCPIGGPVQCYYYLTKP